MPRFTRLVILIKDIYTLWGRKRSFIRVGNASFCAIYIPTNLVCPFTTSNGYRNGRTSNGYKNNQIVQLYPVASLGRIKTRKNAIVEYAHQIPVTPLKGPKGNGDGTKGKWINASSKARFNAPPTRCVNIRLCGRQTDWKTFFWPIDRYWRD